MLSPDQEPETNEFAVFTLSDCCIFQQAWYCLTRPVAEFDYALSSSPELIRVANQDVRANAGFQNPKVHPRDTQTKQEKDSVSRKVNKSLYRNFRRDVESRGRLQTPCCHATSASGSRCRLPNPGKVDAWHASLCVNVAASSYRAVRGLTGCFTERI